VQLFCVTLQKNIYGAVNVPEFDTDETVGPDTAESAETSCSILANQPIAVPDGTGAINPGTPERSGMAIVVDPFW